jgi:hypothetical protein
MHNRFIGTYLELDGLRVQMGRGAYGLFGSQEHFRVSDEPS